MLGEMHNQYLILLFTHLRTKDPEVITAAKVQAHRIKAQIEAACADIKCSIAFMLSPLKNLWAVDQEENLPLAFSTYGRNVLFGAGALRESLAR